jgi:hypothetical protein
VLLALVTIVCAGVIAVPASWAVWKQAEADRGEATPEAAATVWRLKLSAGDESGVSRVLAKSRHAELPEQFVRYREDMAGLARPVSKLEAVGTSVIEHQGDDRATVEEQVRGVRWGDDGTNLAGTAHTWRWELRKDLGGWRVWSLICRHGAECASGQNCADDEHQDVAGRSRRRTWAGPMARRRASGLRPPARR